MVVVARRSVLQHGEECMTNRPGGERFTICVITASSLTGNRYRVLVILCDTEGELFGKGVVVNCSTKVRARGLNVEVCTI